jgi:GNAT superfamily N-acetyltransferase
MITIRKMIKEDITELAVLYKEFWGDNSDINKMNRTFDYLQKNPDYIHLSAVIDNQLAGSVMGIVCHELYGDCHPFMVVEDMIVSKEYRNQGVGYQLFTALEKHARDCGCTQILLVTEENRHDAKRFYESMGFPANKNKGYKKKL